MSTTARAIFTGKRAAPLPAPPRLIGQMASERGFIFASRIAGERALPSERGRVFITPQALCRHLLVCGATGAGKTETLMRLAWVVAKSSDAKVIYLDGKGDRQGAERFAFLMADAGRSARIFPSEPIDGFRGDGAAIKGRLMEIIDFAPEGPAAFYRDIARNVLARVCERKVPRSSAEVLARMRSGAGALGALGISAEQAMQVRMRYEGFFSQCAGALDGGWSLDQTDSAYLLLDSLALREQTGALARFLFEEITHFFTKRKSREQLLVLIVDEFSALAERAAMASRLEQARAFATAIVLAPQVVAGMGGEEESRRIMGSVETVICHRTNTPEDLISLAGTRRAMEMSMAFGPEGSTGAGSGRIQHQFKVDPNRVRQLPAGGAYVISRGKAMRVAVLRAPRGAIAIAAGARLRGSEEVRRRKTGAERDSLPF